MATPAAPPKNLEGGVSGAEWAEGDEGRAEAVGAGGFDGRVTGQDELDAAALDALAPAVDDADLVKACLLRLVEVLLDDGGDVAGGEVVEIDRLLDGHHDRIVVVPLFVVGVAEASVGVLPFVARGGGAGRRGEARCPGRRGGSGQ